MWSRSPPTPLFARFPSWTMNQPPVGTVGTIDPYLAACFAGVKPVLANVDENTIDPFDPAAAGGDAFDLGWLTPLSITRNGVVDRDAIRFVRLVDVIGDGSSTGAFGQPIYDPTGVGIGGADVDSVAVIHGGRRRRSSPATRSLNLPRRPRFWAWPPPPSCGVIEADHATWLKSLHAHRTARRHRDHRDPGGHPVPRRFAARRQAWSQRKSNLRQILIAANAYVQENHGHWPPGSNDITTKNLHRWHGTGEEDAAVRFRGLAAQVASARWR